MARYNEILAGRFNRALQKLLAMKGEVPAPQISSEIYPVVQLPISYDFRFLQSEYRYAAFASIGAVAAQNGTAEIRNPSGSNCMVIIEKVYGQPVTGWYTQQANPVGDLSAAVTTIPLDNRQGITGNASVSKVSTQTLAGLPVGTNTIANVKPGDLIVDVDMELALPPGAALYFQDQTVNEQFIVSLWWRERFLEDSERTG